MCRAVNIVFYPDWALNMEIADRNLFIPQENYDFYCTDVYKTHNQ
jgi:hypothetical protein